MLLPAVSKVTYNRHVKAEIEVNLLFIFHIVIYNTYQVNIDYIRECFLGITTN